MTLVEQIAQLLAQLGVADYQPDNTAGDTFLHRLAEQPDAALAIARYGGIESDAKLGYDAPTIQVRVRGPLADGRIAERRAQDVYDALHGISDRLLAGGTWLTSCIGTQGGPIYIGPDELGRHEFTVNFRLDVRNTAGVRE